MEIGGVEELDTFTLAVGDGDKLAVRNDGNPLRLAEPRQALDVRIALHVEHLDGVVPQRRDVEPLRGEIDGEMIDAPFDARKVNRADEREWRLRRRLKGRKDERREHEREAHGYSLKEFDATLAAPTSTSSANRSPFARSSAAPCFHTSMKIDSGCSITCACGWRSP